MSFVCWYPFFCLALALAGLYLLVRTWGISRIATFLAAYHTLVWTLSSVVAFIEFERHCL